ncbi:MULTISPECIES: murein hydrolase activator EnvC family protein [unclassified Agromyces]|uniref:murein hydrolase activator EnvC family protein n=1 Tax=unclassified Agromyces TaxID=2639701 RepID=UPI0030149875
MTSAPRTLALVVGVAAALLLVVVPPAAAGPAASRPAAHDATPTAPVHRASADGGRWEWPIEPPVRVIAPFRAPPTPYAAGHRGIDLAAAPGTAVRAASDGVVAFAGPVAGRGVLSIDHGDGIVSAIEPVAASVPVGERVTAGQPVGATTAGGHCGEVCAHFGVRVHGEYVSPLWFLGGLPRAVLLPPRG